jgi:hypothetical protein
VTAGRISIAGSEEVVSIGMALAGTVMTTAFSIAITSGWSDSEKRNVTRVRRLPISTTSSAASETTAGGSTEGIATEASRPVSVRSTTKTPGDGLYEV